MMTNKLVLSIVAASAILAEASMSAQAQVGIFDFDTTGTVTYMPGPPSMVDLATSIMVTTPPTSFSYLTSKPIGIFGGLPNGTPVNLTSNTFQTGSGVDFTMAFAGDMLSFTGVPMTAVLGPGTNNGAVATNQWSEIGFLNDSLGLFGPAGLASTLTMSMAQNIGVFSPTVTASWEFVIVILPPPPSTPEPGPYALLASLGLSGA